MPVNFKTTNGDTGATGTDATAKASIQPVANGEPLNQTILQRPTEHLRVRTDELKRSLVETEVQYRLDQGARISTHVPGQNSKMMIEYTAAVTAANRPEIPTALGYRPKLLNNTSFLHVDSPVEGEASFTIERSRLNTFYNTEDDDVGNNDFQSRYLYSRGDTLCAVFDLSGDNSRAVLSNTESGVTNYTPTGTLPLGEEYFAILPSKVCLHDDSASNLVTAFGPGAATEYFNAASSDGWNYPANAYRVGGQSSGESLIFLTIDSYSVGNNAAGNAYKWRDTGGRGGWYTTDGGTTTAKDYLRVRRIKANMVEVYDTYSFRRILTKGEASTTSWLSWSLHDYGVTAANAYTQLGGALAGSNGYIKARDYSDKHVVPLCTYTGDGFSFHPNGGFLGETTDSQTLANGFTLPVNSGGALEDAQGADAGAARIGARAQSFQGGTLAEGTVDTQLKALLDYTRLGVLPIVIEVKHTDLSALVNNDSADHDIAWIWLDNFYGTATGRILSAEIQLVEEFTAGNKVITIDVGTDDASPYDKNLFAGLVVSDADLLGTYRSSLTGKLNGTDLGVVQDTGPGATDDPIIKMTIANATVTDNMNTLTSGILRLVITYTTNNPETVSRNIY